MVNGLIAYRQQWFAGAATARADIIAGVVVALALITMKYPLVALGQFAGNSNRSTHLAVYQPPRCPPICTRHGHTHAAGASISMPWLVTTFGCVTTSSPGRRMARSRDVDP